MSTAEKLAAVLAAHRTHSPTVGGAVGIGPQWACTCGERWSGSGEDWVPSQDTHIAGALAAVVDAERASVAADVVGRATALADEWDKRLQNIFGVSTIFTDWHSRDLRAALGADGLAVTTSDGQP